MGRLSVLAVTTALWLAPAVADAQQPMFGEALERELGREGGVTADEAAHRALTADPAIESARADRRAARERTTVATLAYLPRVTSRLRYMRLSEVEQDPSAPITLPQILDQWSSELSLDVPLSDYLLRLPHQHRAASLTERATESSLEATQRDVATHARLVYWSWARAHLAAMVTAQAHADAIAHVADTRAAQEAGSASIADLLRAESEASTRELAVVRARADETRRADELRTIARLDPERELAIGERLAPSLDLPLDVEPLLEAAYSSRPELDSLAHIAGAERSRGTAARAAAYPRLNLLATATMANPNQRVFPQHDEFDSSWQAGVELSWSFSGIQSAMAEGRAYDASADAYDADRDALRDAIRREVVDGVASVREAEASVATTAHGLESAEEQHRVRRELYLAGRATASEVLDAETALVRARLDAIEARIAREVAHVRLDAAIGR